MFIDEERKIIFVHNPKAAGSTIHVAIKDLYNFKLGSPERNDPEPHIHHSSYQQILDMKKEYEEYYSFAAVRNPWGRLLSGYMDFTQNRKHKYSGLITYDKPLLSEYKNFKDFVMRIDEGKWVDDVHFLPQHIFTHANKQGC